MIHANVYPELIVPPFKTVPAFRAGAAEHPDEAGEGMAREVQSFHDKGGGGGVDFDAHPAPLGAADCHSVDYRFKPVLKTDEAGF